MVFMCVDDNLLNFSEINKINCKNYIFLRFCLVERMEKGNDRKITINFLYWLRRKMIRLKM